MPGPGPLAAAAALALLRLAGVQQRCRSLMLRVGDGDLDQLARWAATGEIRVPVSSEYALDHAADALDASKGGHMQGKVVVRPKELANS